MRTICFCNSNIPWGGGEAWHLNAALALADRGWRVLLLCHPEGELYKRAAAGRRITAIPVRMGRCSFLNPFLRARLRRLFRRERPHAVLMNLPADLKLAGPAARQAGVKHVVYRRGSALPVRDSLMNRHLYGTVITRLVVNSLATRDQVLANNPGLIAPERITVIPNGVDIDAFDAALARAGRAAPLAPPSSGPCSLVMGNAGRLNRQKGQHMILQLGRKLLDAGVDCRVIIAGEGERERELKQLAERLGLGDRAVFCGFMADLSPFWLAVDVFVLTSLWEGFGNVVIEAGLAEKPVLAFAVSNLPELIHEGPDGNGMLFPLPDGVEKAALRTRGRSGLPESPEAEYGAAPGTRGFTNVPTAGRGRTALRACGSETSTTGPQGNSAPEKERPYEAMPESPLQAMAEALLELAGAPEKREAMGRAGRRMALRFSQDRCMDALEAVLR